jgi:hypothetical protein
MTSLFDFFKSRVSEMLSFHHVSSLMNDHDEIASSHIASLNSMFFDLLSLRVSEMMSSCHMSFPTDSPNGFRTSLVHFSLDPTTIGPCAKSDGLGLFSSCTLFTLSERGFQWSRYSPLLDPTTISPHAQIGRLRYVLVLCS